MSCQCSLWNVVMDKEEILWMLLIAGASATLEHCKSDACIVLIKTVLHTARDRYQWHPRVNELSEPVFTDSGVHLILRTG